MSIVDKSSYLCLFNYKYLSKILVRIYMLEWFPFDCRILFKNLSSHSKKKYNEGKNVLMIFHYFVYLGCMACLTAYIIYFCTETHYEKCLKKVSRFVHEQNEQVGF